MGDLVLIDLQGTRLPIEETGYKGIIVSGETFTFEALEEVVRYYLELHHDEEDTQTIKAGDKKVKITIEVL